jgi:hypothetical protein
VSLEQLDRGDKVDTHLGFYPPEMRVLDTLAKTYRTSRSAVLAELIKAHLAAGEPPITDVPVGRGKRYDVHVFFFEPEVVLLDRWASQYRVSRSAVLGQMLRKHRSSGADFNNVPAPSNKHAARSRRAGAGRPAIMTKPLTETYED